MTSLALLRHAPTEWSAARRIQGRSDPGLSAEGRARVAAWQLDEALRRRLWYTSPLRRAVETAALLGLNASPEPRLIETHWGTWEGRIYAELRAEDPAGMARIEAQGLDLRPPGGESPRDVQARLTPFLRDVAARGEPSGAVAHRGVIRALYALATGWDMKGEPPVRLASEAVHFFAVREDGSLAVDRLNAPLLRGNRASARSRP
jgi:broad specificity phosphatase PhoE